MQNSTLVKSDVQTYVKEVIVQKIAKLQNFMEFTLEASREVKKTSKYDSIREEMQEEIYQMQKQLASLRDLQRTLHKIQDKTSDKIQVGSIVFTNKARFYISVSLGEFSLKEIGFMLFPRKVQWQKLCLANKLGIHSPSIISVKLSNKSGNL